MNDIDGPERNRERDAVLHSSLTGTTVLILEVIL
jgi:hypothetical protein